MGQKIEDTEEAIKKMSYMNSVFIAIREFLKKRNLIHTRQLDENGKRELIIHLSDLYKEFRKKFH